MNITQVKLLFDKLPKLRNTDVISSGASKILIDSTNSEYVDIGLLHNASKEKGLTGIKYHYVIKNNGQYDGVIYYCRPLIYQNELEYGTGVIRDSVLIGMAGYKTDNITNAQIDSLVKLIKYLVLNENYRPMNVNFMHEINGTAADIPNWNEVKNLLYGSENILTALGLLGGDFTDDNTDYDVLVGSEDIKSFNDVFKITKVPPSVLGPLNEHILDPDNIEFNEIIYVPRNPLSLSLRGEQQLSNAFLIAEEVTEKVEITIIEKEDYIAAKDDPLKFDIYSTNNLSQARGGKKEPFWYKYGYELPGYHNAVIQFVNTKNGAVTTIPFLVSPSSLSDTRSNMQQVQKTNGGFFILRSGKNVGSLGLSGYMLDINSALERHDFLKQYKDKVEDRKNSDLEYINNYSTRVIVEGREYNGLLQSLSFSKSAIQPFLYQYSMQFIVLNDREVYDVTQRAISETDINQLSNEANVNEIVLADGVYEAMNKEMNELVEIASDFILPNAGRLRW